MIDVDVTRSGDPGRARGTPWGNRGRTMRKAIAIISLWILCGGSAALTPLPDKTLGAFAGEWVGTGALGAYCYVELTVEGRGTILVDAGAGTWAGARIRWHNQQQSVQIDSVVPLAASPQLRTSPLRNFTLRSTFNQSLRLGWPEPDNICHLQRQETTAEQLVRARHVRTALPPGAPP